MRFFRYVFKITLEWVLNCSDRNIMLPEGESLVKRRITYIFVVICIVLSLMPIVYLFGYDFATGDDYGYGAAVKHAWENSHSLSAIFQAAKGQVIGTWHSWQGTWFSVFLFTLNPENFGFGLYSIVPFIMIILHAFAAYFLVKTFFADRFLLGRGDIFIVSSLLFFINVQFCTSYQCNIYWWVGSVHYVIPFFLSTLILLVFSKFLQEYRIRYIVLLTIFMTMLSGGSYQMALVTPLVILCIMAWKKFVFKEKFRKRIYLLLIPFATYMAGLVISMISPGNKNRGGEAFGFSASYGLVVIARCFATAIEYICSYVTSKSLMFVILAIYAMVVYFVIKEACSLETDENRCGNPLLMILLSFCIFSATFAPELYAAVSVSGGVYNTYVYVFTFLCMYDIAYVEKYFILKRTNCHKALQKTLKDKRPQSLFKVKSKKIRGQSLNKALLFVLLVVAVILSRHSVKTMTAYVCYDYISSGRAADYKEQMILQHDILVETTEGNEGMSAVIPAVNDDQGPLQHMPVTSVSDAWTNRVTANYYGLDSVIAIDRNKWEEIYGAK